jgi:DNA-binding CsgD family transcriptional regulator
LAAGAFYFICKSRKIKMSKDEIGEAFHISGRTVYSNERRISELMSAKSFRS